MHMLPIAHSHGGKSQQLRPLRQKPSQNTLSEKRRYTIRYFRYDNDVGSLCGIGVVVVFVAESSQAPKYNPEKCLCTRLEACLLMDGLPKVQSFAACVEVVLSEPQVVMCLIFIVTHPARNFF